MYPQSPGTKPNHKPAGNLVRGRRQGGGRREDLTWLTGSSNYPQSAGTSSSLVRGGGGVTLILSTRGSRPTHTHQLPPAAAFTFLIPRLGPSAQCLNLNSQPSIVWVVVVVVARPCVPATSSEDAVLFTSH